MNHITKIAVVPICLIAVISVAAGQKIYWVEHSQGTILRANLDGTAIKEIVGPKDTNLPWAIALDPTAAAIYWTSVDDSKSVGRIQRAKLDRSNVEEVVPMTGFNFGGVALDPIAGKTYFTDPSDCFPLCGCVKRANLDGSGVEVLVNATTPNAIALDLNAGKAYWAEPSSETEASLIRRANLDGTDAETVLETSQVRGILLAYNAVRFLMHQAAVSVDIDPRRLSFIHAVRVLRETAPLMRAAPASRLPIFCAAMIQHIAQGRLPPRDNRINPRVVKRKMSNFGKKRPEHYRVPQPQTSFRQSVVILK